MNILVFEAKTLEDAIAKATSELEVSETDFIYKKEETKGGLFKSGGIKLSIVLYTDVCEHIKTYLAEILKLMDIETSFETKIREGKIQIKMYSDRNAILIGKGGKTLTSLQMVLKQMIYNQIQMYPYFVLDVENYKEKQEEYLEIMASKVAKEVAKTKIDVVLENMNSYERRIVHNYLTEFDNIYTTSEGEEPERHIVIKYKED